MDALRKSMGSLVRLAVLLVVVLPAFAGAKSKEPIGIALEIEDGVGVPVQLAAGRTYYVDVFDMRASLRSTVDAGVSSLAVEGDFADLPWYGIQLEDVEPNLLPNPDGTFTRRSFYTNALWMELPSLFIVQQIDDRERPLGLPVILNAGLDDLRTSADTFFIRRMRAIQWARDCATLTDCSTATNFEEEALIELRNVIGKPQTFKLHPRTTALRVLWSLKLWQPYDIPVHQVKKPDWDYGFEIAVDPVTPPRPDGTYAPGTDVTFRVTLKDGNGKRLHPQGQLPTYTEGAFLGHPAGIWYYNAFSDPSATYWRRKHRERMLMAQIIGPAQHIQPIRDIAHLEEFFVPGAQIVGRPERDGVFGEFQIIPEAWHVFGGAFFPELGMWDLPTSDEVTFHIPPNADPGTYLVTVKGRRVYLGEDRPYTKTIEIQVGQRQRTVPHLNTGNCQSCHKNGGELSKVLHANDNRAACAACHVPLSFELEGPIFVRTHFIHSRTDRFGADLKNCSNCHLDRQGIQRVSKAACLSCHKSYPDWHVAQFGPVESAYVGGGEESFIQCTDSCHTNHPGSRL